jgi:hypothetical protein
MSQLKSLSYFVIDTVSACNNQRYITHYLFNDDLESATRDAYKLHNEAADHSLAYCEQITIESNPDDHSPFLLELSISDAEDQEVFNALALDHQHADELIKHWRDENRPKCFN